jgi:hypothetical protein
MLRTWTDGATNCPLQSGKIRGKFSHSKDRNVTRGDVKRYTVNFNEIAEQYFKDHVTDILIWRSRAALGNYVLKHAPWHLDGVHMSVSVYVEELQLLVNHLIDTKAC